MLPNLFRRGPVDLPPRGNGLAPFVARPLRNFGDPPDQPVESLLSRQVQVCPVPLFRSCKLPRRQERRRLQCMPDGLAPLSLRESKGEDRPLDISFDAHRRRGDARGTASPSALLADGPVPEIFPLKKERTAEQHRFSHGHVVVRNRKVHAAGLSSAARRGACPECPTLPGGREDIQDAVGSRDGENPLEDSPDSIQEIIPGAQQSQPLDLLGKIPLRGRFRVFPGEHEQPAFVDRFLHQIPAGPGIPKFVPYHPSRKNAKPSQSADRRQEAFGRPSTFGGKKKPRERRCGIDRRREGGEKEGDGRKQDGRHKAGIRHHRIKGVEFQEAGGSPGQRGGNVHQPIPSPGGEEIPEQQEGEDAECGGRPWSGPAGPASPAPEIQKQQEMGERKDGNGIPTDDPILSLQEGKRVHPFSGRGR
jgi:hypothetical protein